MPSIEIILGFKMYFGLWDVFWVLVNIMGVISNMFLGFEMYFNFCFGWDLGLN